MVLINNLTIDEINAALLHLQRSQGEVVGGEKGTTIQNISLRNEGGTSGTDYSDAISKINETLDEHEKELGEMGVTDAKMQTQLDRLAGMVENLSTSGINSVSFDDDTRTLSIELTDGQVYEVEIPEDSISLEFDANTNQLILSYGDVESKVTLPYINTNKLGVANGVATLDSSGRVPYSQLPESAMEFKGEWDASTNTPHLADGSGTNGDFYICNAGGTVTFGTGNTQTFMVNDRVLYNGATSKWIKLPAGQVTSVNSMTGDVVVDANNINYNSNTTVKQAIDSKANTSDVVQSDWTQTSSSQKDFIKHKIPIWITSGSADDNMSPIDSVTNGSSRPITSNAVADVLNNPITATFSNNTGTDVIIHLGTFTPSLARRIGIIAEAEGMRVDGSSKVWAVVGNGNINVLSMPSVGTTYSPDFYLYRTSDYQYDLYLKVATYSRAFIKLTGTTSFSYDGTTVSSYIGSKVTGQYTTLPIT